jgi:hypothetical protein
MIEPDVVNGIYRSQIIQVINANVARRTRRIVAADGETLADLAEVFFGRLRGVDAPAGEREGRDAREQEARGEHMGVVSFH